MTTGAIIFVIITILIYVAFGSRVLDRLYLTDNQALFVLALIPLLLSIYIILKIDSKEELRITFISIIITGILITFIQKVSRTIKTAKI